MAQFLIDLEKLGAELSALGLRNFGIFKFEKTHLRQGDDRLLGATGILIGNAGSDMWNVFSGSPEYADGSPDPMNRWTKRVVESLADGVCETCIFPFDKPYWPFQRFLNSAAGSKPSPLGLYIHPEFGLWHALRSVLVFGPDQEFTSQINAEAVGVKKWIHHPCDMCADKSCLSACPVSAFDGTSLNVSLCFPHIDSLSEPKCLEQGCAARHACPVGSDYRYSFEQLRFHMKAYRY